MSNTSVEAFAPASMGNVGIGFDILGLAFQEPGDRVIAELSEDIGVTIAQIYGDEGQLPRQAEKNTAGVAVISYLKYIRAEVGIRLTIYKGLPLASGLGSSAASAVAAVVAANALLGDALPRRELLPACLEGEALVSGYHADNIGPSLLGGITLITGTQPSQIHQLPVPHGMHFALVTPHVAVPTAQARAVLPQTIPLKTFIRQSGHVALMIDALYRDDLAAVAAAMEADSIIEPARAHLMPLLEEARACAKRAGAMALVISGAGPTLCAVCDDRQTSQRVANALQALYDEAQIGADVRTTCVCEKGARVV